MLVAASTLALSAPGALASGGGSGSGGGGGSAPPTQTLPVLQSVTFAPASAAGGSPATGSVRFASVTDGALVHLTSSNPAVVQVPAETVVAGGQASGSFAISTSPVSAATPVTVTATAFGATVSGTFSVPPGAPAASDVVRVTRAEWNVGILRIEATSTNPSAILSVSGADGELMFTLNNNGGGRYSIQRSWLDNPGTITVTSNLGGSATTTVS